jgi:hypothetical protein
MSVGTDKTCPVCRAEPSEKERIVLERCLDHEGVDEEAVVAGSLLMLSQLAFDERLRS